MEHRQNPPPRGLKRDFQRVKEHGGASASELRDFVQQMNGRSTQEVLGLVAQSGLARAMGAATIGTLVLLVVFTLVPWGLAKRNPPAPPVTPPAAAATAAEAPAADSAVAPGANAATADAPVQATPELVEKLEESEVIETDLDSNPLEDSADDLLDDLD